MIGPAQPLRPGAGSSPAPALAPALSPERAALREAAEGFEAIMLRRMLASARAASFAEETPLTGGGLRQFEAMRDEHFADAAARSGAFGFARSIEASLAQHLSGHDPDQGDS